MVRSSKMGEIDGGGVFGKNRMNLQPLHSDSVAGILQLAAQARRREINQSILAATRGRVVAGPFEGMVLPDEASWLDGDIAPKLLGLYEAELHGLVRHVAGKNYPVVVNVGCAEGYYAIGLARLMPQATIYAFDTSTDAQTVCRNAAAMNGVADRITVGGRCEAEAIGRILPPDATAFLMLDCEGGEKELLDPGKTPALIRCDFVAECHDFYDRSITPTIVSRFAETHEIRVIREGARDPNAVAMLTSLSSLDRWLTVCEFRPEAMHWIIATRKQG